MGDFLIRHVRYEDFVTITSDGVGDLLGFQSAADALARRMGDLHYHHVLVDLRVRMPPIPRPFWSKA